MAIFNSYVSLPEGIYDPHFCVKPKLFCKKIVQFCPVEDPDPTVRCALAHASTIISPWGDESMTTAASHEEERVCGYGAQRCEVGRIES